MSFIDRERERIDREYRSIPETDPRRPVLHAARQALAWALEPEGFMPPLQSIIGSDNLPNSKDCSAHSRPPSS
jgi:hypothetical protein